MYIDLITRHEHIPASFMHVLFVFFFSWGVGCVGQGKGESEGG